VSSILVRAREYLDRVVEAIDFVLQLKGDELQVQNEAGRRLDVPVAVDRVVVVVVAELGVRIQVLHLRRRLQCPTTSCHKNKFKLCGNSNNIRGRGVFEKLYGFLLGLRNLVSFLGLLSTLLSLFSAFNLAWFKYARC